MELRLIPTGEYLRGSSDADVAAAVKADPYFSAELAKAEQPQHRVRITQPFYMAKYETTQGDFQKLLKRNTAKFRAGGEYARDVRGMITTQFPIENVTWFDAIEFCNALSRAENKKLCYELTDIERDTDESITLRTAEGIAKTVAKDSVEIFKKQPLSLMPQNLQQMLTVEQLVDVVEYTLSLTK